MLLSFYESRNHERIEPVTERDNDPRTVRHVKLPLSSRGSGLPSLCELNLPAVARQKFERAMERVGHRCRPPKRRIMDRKAQAEVSPPLGRRPRFRVIAELHGSGKYKSIEYPHIPVREAIRLKSCRVELDIFSDFALEPMPSRTRSRLHDINAVFKVR